MMEPNYSTDHPIFTQARYASFWERFGAAFLDGLMLGILQFIMRFFVEENVNTVLNFLVGWLYYAVMESGPNQATLGKKALGLKVTNMNGGPITFGQATGRYFGKILSAIILLIGYLMMLWDNKKQTLHDKLAGTLV
ncbi:RDD family protein, partial [Cnuella takakiae]